MVVVTEKCTEHKHCEGTQYCTYNYALELKQSEIEDQKYIGYGISVQMRDNDGNTSRACIHDITSKPEVASQLLALAQEHAISPMCLKMFVEKFLFEQQYDSAVEI